MGVVMDAEDQLDIVVPEEAEPVRDPILHISWPKDWMPPFLASLRGNGNIRGACEHAGVSRPVALYWRAKHAEFRKVWDTCMQDAIDLLEQAAWQRAITNTRSDQLLWNMLSSLRRQKYGQRIEIEMNVRRHVEAAAEKYKLDPKELLAEAEAILAGSATVDPADESILEEV